MSKRTRLLELSTAASLAGSDLERERLKGEREARTTSQWIDAIAGLPELAVQAVGAYSDHVDEEAMRKADLGVAELESERGEGVIASKIGADGRTVVGFGIDTGVRTLAFRAVLP